MESQSALTHTHVATSSNDLGHNSHAGHRASAEKAWPYETRPSSIVTVTLHQLSV